MNTWIFTSGLFSYPTFLASIIISNKCQLPLRVPIFPIVRKAESVSPQWIFWATFCVRWNKPLFPTLIPTKSLTIINKISATTKLLSAHFTRTRPKASLSKRIVFLFALDRTRFIVNFRSWNRKFFAAYYTHCREWKGSFFATLTGPFLPHVTTPEFYFAAHFRTKLMNIPPLPTICWFLTNKTFSFHDTKYITMYSITTMENTRETNRKKKGLQNLF